jgi:hypothetical protein
VCGRSRIRFLCNIFLVSALSVRITGAGNRMDSLSLRLSLFLGVHAGLVLAVLLLA